MRKIPALDHLSPTIVAQVRYPQQPTSAERAKYVGRVRREVRACRQCELVKHCTQHVPVLAPRDPKFVVVGEAPGPQEDKLGEPFRGPAGKLLRLLMHEAGIDSEADAAWCNTVSCFPNTEGKVRAPSASESLACRGNLLAQLEAGYTAFVLLVGGHALRSFRTDLTVTHDHGKVFVWNDLYVVMPILHPAAVLRGQSGFKKLIRDDLARWKDIVEGDDDPLQWIGDACVKCGGDAVQWDRDAVPYCERHWEKWKNQWEKERVKWTGKPAVQLELI